MPTVCWFGGGFSCPIRDITFPPSFPLPALTSIGASLSGEPGVQAHSSSICNSQRQNSTVTAPALVPLMLLRLGPSEVSNPPCRCCAVLPRAGGMPSVTKRRGWTDEPWLRLQSEGLVGLQRDRVKGFLQFSSPVSFSKHRLVPPLIFSAWVDSRGPH